MCSLAQASFQWQKLGYSSVQLYTDVLLHKLLQLRNTLFLHFSLFEEYDIILLNLRHFKWTVEVLMQSWLTTFFFF